MSDGSIDCQRKDGRRTVSANGSYSVELVSPILLYREDIDTVQGLARAYARQAGLPTSPAAFTSTLTAPATRLGASATLSTSSPATTICSTKALQIAPERMRYCKKMDVYLVERMNRIKPKTFSKIESIWYEGYRGNRNTHYHDSRYHFLNLHSFFHGNHTVELRGFNGTLHAGKIRAYIVFALALNHQALTQKSASYRKVQEENEKFAMRVYLNRIGFIGDEFKSCREHLYQHLDGNAAWRYGSREKRPQPHQPHRKRRKCT